MLIKLHEASQFRLKKSMEPNEIAFGVNIFRTKKILVILEELQKNSNNFFNANIKIWNEKKHMTFFI